MIRKDNKRSIESGKVVKSPSQGFKKRLNDTLDSSIKRLLMYKMTIEIKLIPTRIKRKWHRPFKKKPKQDDVKVQEELESELIRTLQIENNNEEGQHVSYHRCCFEICQKTYTILKRGVMN
ncbi:hypothetical protein CEXT_536421 [Caerostris extrusa]|uniref:Uncharacterized protein n=1 Tax=Caerostris extrusa TaxID=172846 RepID=A0AAV4SID7_CAEEX|nr:hypothetical protein CEXT_536421 [Caerostris extrusa]